MPNDGTLRKLQVTNSDLLKANAYSTTATRCRLDSRSSAIYSRMLSAQLFVVVCLVGMFTGWLAVQARDWLSLERVLLVVLAGFFVARHLWRRPKQVFASESGLEFGDGNKRRLIPWSRVLDIREVPSVRVHPFRHPRLWQVDLDHEQSFDFCGTPHAREIVADFIERAERPPRQSAGDGEGDQWLP
jgi:hypothetical protein